MQVGINDGDSHLCSFAGCTEIDLLPARCTNCRRTFCSAHIGSSAHHCPAVENVVVAECPICTKVVPLEYPGQRVDEAVSRHIERGCRDVPQSFGRSSPGGGRRLMDDIPCEFPNCKETSVVRCDLCNKRFCVSHRDPGRHSCKNRRSPPPQAVSATETNEPARPVAQGPSTVADLLLRPANTRDTAVGKASEAKVDMVVPLVSFVIPTPGNPSVVYGIAPFFMHVLKNYALGKVLDLAVNEGGQRTAVVRNMKKPWKVFIVPQPTPQGATPAMYAPVSLTTVVKNSALVQQRSADGTAGDAIIFITPLEQLPPEALTASRSVRLKSKEDSDSCHTM